MFPERGRSLDAVLSEILRIREKDPSTEDGTILGTMITTPHPISLKVVSMYLSSTLSDPIIFEEAARLEKEVIAALGDLLNGSNIMGIFTSGGSEANVLGAYMLRQVSGKKYIVVPETAHFSFLKAEKLGIVRLKLARVDDRLKVDPESVERLIDDSVGGIVGIAVNTDAGSVDPIYELNRIALEHDLHVYVDAALGGLVLPFMKDLGLCVPSFDFELERVLGMCVDPHKFGLTPPPAGTFLFRENIADIIHFKATYYFEERQYSIVSTRPAWPPVVFWGVINTLGREGFRNLVRRCLGVRDYAVKRLEEEGLEVPMMPETIIVNVQVKNPRKVATFLRKRFKISVGVSPRLSSLRIVIMPHVTEESIERLIDALKFSIKELNDK